MAVRRVQLKYQAQCASCDDLLLPHESAYWDSDEPEGRRVFCLECGERRGLDEEVKDDDAR